LRATLPVNNYYDAPNNRDSDGDDFADAIRAPSPYGSVDVAVVNLRAKNRRAVSKNRCLITQNVSPTRTTAATRGEVSRMGANRS
jgi:hypothetical protein